MTVEVASYINDLNEAYPRARDLIKEGDDHIRLIKTTLKNTFPGITTPVNLTSAYLNSLEGILTIADSKFTLDTSFYVTGNRIIDMGGNRIRNVGNPVEDQDAVTVAAAKNLAWPVGSVYISIDSRNPASIFGFGVWERFANGRVMIGAGTLTDGNNDVATYVNGEMGGAMNGVLSERHLARHSHDLANVSTSSAGNHKHDSGVAIRGATGNPYGVAAMTPNMHSYEHHRYGDNIGRPYTSTDGAHTHSVTGTVDYTGNGEKFPIMQPWVACNIWVRKS